MYSSRKRWAWLLVVTLMAVYASTGLAAGEETLTELQARMDSIQARLDATTARIHSLESDQAALTDELEDIEARSAEIESKRSELQDDVVARANALYRSGSNDVLEILFTSQNVSQLTSRIDILSEVTMEDSTVFVTYARQTAELEALEEEAIAKQDALAATEEELEGASDELLADFGAVKDEYIELKRKIAQLAPPPVPGPAPAGAPAPPPGAGAAAAAPPSRPKGDITCPVDGPVSFIDSWGYPRSGGRTHEGTDMMADFGTPVVAIVSGSITYAGWGDSAGNWLILSGDDGHGYWYMHNQTNNVGLGRVTVGQQIATVGDTGNASGGPPHVHFEYHPGGGGPVNPYPMLEPLC
ncbi:MAG TPA: peptidoglycan DD-metalloendopeptidase family protein [Actinomycetota bacterium]|nr:peptidoglycan DD-metalloendopeptidase family protein [Actinomycetota bacterium]